MRCKPLPGPREGLNPLAAFERYPEPLCSRYCGPSAMSRTEVSDEPAARSIESRSSEETSKGFDPPLSKPRCGGDDAVSQRAAGSNDEDISSAQFRLHDAQSCIAREHGFASWSDLKHYVEVQAARRKERGARILHWARLLYSGDVSGTTNRANPRVALRMLAEDPDIVANDPWLACAIGDEHALRRATQTDPAWVNRPGGPLRLPPLIAVTHSSLLRVEEFR